MKIVHYIASIDEKGGGTTEYMRLLTSALKSEMSLIIATGYSANPIVIEGVSVKFFNSSVFRWFSLITEFRTFLKFERPDIVHINGIWSPQNWGFQKVAQELQIKVILSPHGMLEPWILDHNPVKKKLARFLFQNKAIHRADFLHATAQMEKDSIVKLGFRNPIVIIPNGIDLSEITTVKSSYGSKKMIFLSRIHPKKGIELLLEAWQNTDTNGWSLEIAGNGDSNYIQKLAQSAKYLENVHFVGSKYGDDKWNFLRSADVIVLPTHSENFGIVVAESLGVGLPVITTKGTPWEDLEIKHCGWWIDLSVLDIENTLATVFKTSTQQLETMGKKGRKLIEDKYNINAIGSKMIELYNIV
jgi:glycosyltransferase involved in cell wall biosynthesis